MTEPIRVVFTRGGLRESVHHVHTAVVRPDGELLRAAGNADLVTFPRSTGKPVQALPLARALPDLPLDELAIACASHAGTDTHLPVVRRLLARAGLTESDLACGTHPPFNVPAQHELVRHGEAPTVLHHNCSGKHAGMLVTCVLRGWPTHGYESPHHPLQREIHELHAELGGVAKHDVLVGRDGCSVPAFAMSVRAGARVFAHLARPTGPHAAELERVFTAMRTHPDLIAGPGRLDTDLMPRVPGAISKMGAEGYFGLALRDTPHGPLGITFKVEDGSERPRPHVTLALLDALGVQYDPQLRDLHPATLRNFAGHEVGSVSVELPPSMHPASAVSA